MKNKNLFLVVTKKWYEEIASGRKRVEYREYTDYWIKRLDNPLRSYDTIEFQCGYSKKLPCIKFKLEHIDFVYTPSEVKDTVKTEYCFAIWFE